MKSSANYPTMESYLNSLNDGSRTDIETLHKFIIKTAPNLKPKMWGNIIGYGEYHYKYASGREGDWMLIGLCARAHGISIYICAIENNRYISEEYKDAYPKTSVGKSCIRFKNIDEIDFNLLEKLIKKAVSTVS